MRCQGPRINISTKTIQPTPTQEFAQEAEASLRSDSELLWCARFSLRERFIKSRSRRSLYATKVRLDDQCVWARAIDVSWTQTAENGRCVVVARASDHHRFTT